MELNGTIRQSFKQTGEGPGLSLPITIELRPESLIIHGGASAGRRTAQGELAKGPIHGDGNAVPIVTQDNLFPGADCSGPNAHHPFELRVAAPSAGPGFHPLKVGVVLLLGCE